MEDIKISELKKPKEKDELIEEVHKLIEKKTSFNDMFLSEAAKVVVVFYMELRKSTLQQYSYHIEKIKFLIKTGVSPKDLLLSIWNLQHSSFANDKKIWIGGWSLNYFYRKNNTVEKALKSFKFDLKPTEDEINIAKKYSHLLQQEISSEEDEIKKLREKNNNILRN